MKITMIGPGIMPIPPTGWGAVEILIWDYKQILEYYGHVVQIINTANFDEIVNQCNNWNPDFVHVQYDDHYHIIDKLNCEKIAITSHFGYLDQESKYGSYTSIFNGFLNLKKAKIFALSPSIKNKYIQYGFNANDVFVTPNGVRDDLFKFEKECSNPDHSIYLAKIDHRKRQFLFHNIDNLYFAGKFGDNKYNQNNYLGDWPKDYLYENLTKFANMVLLSDGEAHPLVCMEALCAGLGIVISEWATANLDITLPFIDVIPENKIHDTDYVSYIISENRKKSIRMREEIRAYAVNNFSWKTVIKNYYLPSIKSF